MKILSLHCVEGPEAPQHESTAVDARKTHVMWQSCSHARCHLVLMGGRGSGASRRLRRWEVGGGKSGWQGGEGVGERASWMMVVVMCELATAAVYD